MQPSVGVCEAHLFSAGAVNHNLQAMKQRVNSTLVTFESVTRALEATASQLKKEQAHAVSGHAQTPLNALLALGLPVTYPP